MKVQSITLWGLAKRVRVTLVNSVHTLTLARPCNFLSLPRICLRCPQLSNSGNMRGNVDSADIIVSIPTILNRMDKSCMKNIYSIAHLKSDRIERLNIQLTDDDGNLIDFNGISSFLLFNLIYLEKV